MAKTVANVAIATDTFAGWLYKTNVLLDSLTTEMVTVSNSATGHVVSGNGSVVGTLGANTITALRVRGGGVGNTVNIASLAIGFANTTHSSNVSVEGLLVTINTVTTETTSNTTTITNVDPSSVFKANVSTIGIYGNTTIGSNALHNVIISGTNTFINTATSRIASPSLDVTSNSTINATSLIANVSTIGIYGNTTIGSNALHNVIISGTNTFINTATSRIASPTLDITSNSTVNATSLIANVSTIGIYGNTTIGSNALHNVIISGTNTFINTATSRIASPTLDITSNSTVNATSLIANVSTIGIYGNTTIGSNSLHNVIISGTNTFINTATSRIASPTLDITSNSTVNATSLVANVSTIGVYGNTTIGSNALHNTTVSGTTLKVTSNSTVNAASLIANVSTIGIYGNTTIGSNALHNTTVSGTTLKVTSNSTVNAASLVANVSTIGIYGNTTIGSNALHNVIISGTNTFINTATSRIASPSLDVTSNSTVNATSLIANVSTIGIYGNTTIGSNSLHNVIISGTNTYVNTATSRIVSPTLDITSNSTVNATSLVANVSTIGIYGNTTIGSNALHNVIISGTNTYVNTATSRIASPSLDVTSNSTVNAASLVANVSTIGIYGNTTIGSNSLHNTTVSGTTLKVTSNSTVNAASLIANVSTIGIYGNTTIGSNALHNVIVSGTNTFINTATSRIASPTLDVTSNSTVNATSLIANVSTIGIYGNTTIGSNSLHNVIISGTNTYVNTSTSRIASPTLDVTSNSTINAASLVANVSTIGIYGNTTIGSNALHNVIISGTNTFINTATSRIASFSLDVTSNSTINAASLVANVSTIGIYGNTTIGSNALHNVIISGTNTYVNTTYSRIASPTLDVTSNSTINATSLIANVSTIGIYGNTTIGSNSLHNTTISSKTLSVTSNTTTITNISTGGTLRANVLTIGIYGNTTTIGASTFGSVNIISGTNTYVNTDTSRIASPTLDVTSNSTVNATSLIANVSTIGIYGNTTIGSNALHNVIISGTNTYVNTATSRIASPTLDVTSNSTVNATSLIANVSTIGIYGNTTIGSNALHNVIISGTNTFINTTTSEVTSNATVIRNTNSGAVLTANVSTIGIYGNTTIGSNSLHNTTISSKTLSVTSNTTTITNISTGGTLRANVLTIGIYGNTTTIGASTFGSVNIISGTNTYVNTATSRIASPTLDITSNSTVNAASLVANVSTIGIYGNTTIGSNTLHNTVISGNTLYVNSAAYVNIASNTAVSNNLTVTNNLTLQGRLQFTSNSVVMTGSIGTYTFPTNSTTANTIDSFTTDDLRSARYSISARSTANPDHVILTDVLGIFGATGVHSTEYGTVYSNTKFMTYALDVSGTEAPYTVSLLAYSNGTVTSADVVIARTAFR